MRNILSIVLLAFAVSFGAPVESAKNTIFILLSTVDGNSTGTSSIWNTTGVENYVRNTIVGKNSYLYSTVYNTAESTPAVFANEKFAAQDATKSILKDALKKWYDNNTDSKIKSFGSLENLKKNRPDLVPSRYVVIAEGAAGLAVREYIQSVNYKGEIENVLFFNTPHEGTGYADQALFNTNTSVIEKSSSSSLASLIPMILAAYLFDKVGVVEELLIGLGKDVIMSMAYNQGDITQTLKDTKLFDGAGDLTKQTLWYLTQDADVADPTYKNLLSKAGVATSFVDTLVGSTQLLNSISKKTDFRHPNYNLVYSYGLPSIGNGRRTLDDFMDQKKFHISDAKIKKEIKDNLMGALKEEFKDELDAHKDELEKTLKDYADQIVNSDFVSNLGDFAKDLADEYSFFKGKADEIQQTMKDYNVAGYIEGVSKLRNYEFNKDDIVGSVIELIAIVEKFIPKEYKSEIYSVFMDEIAPLAESISQASGYIKDGMKVVSSSLSSYSLNFFDEGTFDVPSYSAMAENVAAFRDAGASRIAMDLSSLVKGNSLYKDLANYSDKLNDIGDFEETRKIVDAGLKLTCLGANVATPAAEEACKAAEFATNVAMISEMSSKIKSVVELSGRLKETKKVALTESVVKREQNLELLKNTGVKIKASKIDSMLFENPLMTFASVQKIDGRDTIVVPLLLDKPCNSDIYDLSTFNSCGVSTVKEINPDVRNITELSFLNKDVPVSNKFGYKEFSRQTIYQYIKEYRFKVLDLQPDSLRMIKFDFNARIQMLFERDAANKWQLYYGIDNQYESLGELGGSPVRSDGIFIFRPEEIMDRYNSRTTSGDVAKLAAIQEDGANVVNIYTMNKVGYSTNQQFSYRFEATDPLVEEGWPTLNAVVSDLREVYAYFNNLNYLRDVKSVGLRIARSTKDAIYADSIDVPFVLLENTDQKRWRAAIDLSKIPLTNEIVEGSYVLEWNFRTVNDQNEEKDYKINIPVTLDKTPPELDLHVVKDFLSGNSTDGIWAVVENKGPVDNRTIRAMRAYVTNGSNKQELFDTIFTARQFYNFSGDMLKNVSWEGKSTLVIEAYDNVAPDSAKEAILKYSTNPDGAWNLVLETPQKLVPSKNDKVFIPGINGTLLVQNVWMDKSAPEISSVNVSVVSADPSGKRPDGSALKKASGSILNNQDTLHLSFNLKEKVYDRDTTTVKVYISFVDAANKISKTYAGVSGFKKNQEENRYEFIEPNANRLRDGLYDIVVEAVDEAGNVLEKTVASQIAVDRTAPAIFNMGSGNLALETSASLSNIRAEVSQTTDVASNVKAVECYKQLDSAGNVSRWAAVSSLSASQPLETQKYDFTVSDLVSKEGKGTWTVGLKCYDVAGNASIDYDFFEVGVRSPKIEYPNGTINSMYSGKILVRGIAPNPDLSDERNDNTAEYRLEWRRDGESTWNSTDFEYLKTGVASNTRDLAVWDVSKLGNGTYVLRLSTRGCHDDSKCSWERTEETVVVYDNGMSSPVAPVTIDVTSASFSAVDNSHVTTCGTKESMFVELKHVSDTSKWVVNVKIEAASPKDPYVMVVADEWNFNPARVSPFLNKPSVKKDGLNVWQEGKKWHIFWKGTAEGACDEITIDPETNQPYPDRCVSPVLALRTLSDASALETTVKKADEELSIVRMDAVTLNGVTVPSYDEVRKWNLVDGLEIVLESDSAFAIDLSSVKESSSHIYCGGSGSNYKDVVTEANDLGVVYVHPEEYRMGIEWDGTVNGVVPAGNSVKMKVLAYNKNDPSIVVSKEIPWNMKFAPTSIVLDNPQPQTMIVGLSESDAVAAYVRQQLGLSFGLQNQSAFVTATVVNPKGETIKTLLNNEHLLAGNSTNAYELTWGGMSDNSFASSEQGVYKIVIVAKNSAGDVMDTKTYSFNLVYAGKMIAVDESDKTGAYPVFEMDEAVVVNDKLRFVGRPDYLMKLSARDIHLPEESRTLTYHWDWLDEKGGVQFPAMYRLNRFSLGLARHRSRFTVTVAALVISMGYDIHVGWSGCYAGSTQYPYLVLVKKVVFDENTAPKADIELNLDASTEIVAYDKVNKNFIGNWADWTTDRVYGMPSFVAVKILPESAYNEAIKGLSYDSDDGAYVKRSNAADDANSWNGDDWTNKARLLNPNTYKDGKVLHKWMTNWNGQVVLWESKQVFPYYSTGFTMNSEAVFQECKINNEISDDEDPVVCGAARADQETQASLAAYNPHAKMLIAKTLPMVGGELSKGNKTYSVCSEHDGSRTDIEIKLNLEIDKDYWKPAWGTNNLANRYARFDPKNITVYGPEGYFSALKAIDEKQGKNENGNFYNPEKGWEHRPESGKITAFEAERFNFVCSQNNPLLFADELGACLGTAGMTTSLDYLYNESVRPIEHKYSLSDFRWHFFKGNDNVRYKAIAQVRGESNTKFTYSDVATSSTSMNLNSATNPEALVFAVAPEMTAEQAVENPAGVPSIEYPYTGDPWKDIVAPAGYKFYPGFASRIHYGVNDWDDEKWLGEFMMPNTEHVIANPVLKGNVVSNVVLDKDFAKKPANVVNVLDKKYTRKVDPANYIKGQGWFIPSDLIPPAPSDETSIGTGPTGNFKLVCAPSSWDCKKDQDKVWHVTNPGEVTTSEARYILSKSPRGAVKLSDEDRSHSVSLQQVIDQNKKDEILGDYQWSQGLTFDKVELYSRKDTTKLHAYLNAVYKDEDKRFDVTRNGNTPLERVDEIATFSGRVPGEGTKWTIQYTKDGVLFPVASGEQKEVPYTQPYPVFAYFDMHYLQGNTSFFLTYGGTNGSLYFKQLDVHVGEELDPSEGKTIASMYGNVAVEFAAGAWGSSAVDVTVRSVDPTEYLYTSFNGLKIAGPVLEVLPSHKFENSSLYPNVVVTLTRDDVEKNHYNVEDLKIYKPDFETEEIVALEQVGKTFFDADNKPLGNDAASAPNWAYVTLKARTASFSSFVVTDDASIAALPAGGTSVDDGHFDCVADVPTDLLWAGTANGWLEYPYPCNGKSNYMLQLRVGAEIAAEHQEASSKPIVWYVRKTDLNVESEVYSSKIKFSGVNGAVVQKAGPDIRIDPEAPVIENADVEIVEDGNKRILRVTADLEDVGSGIKQTTVEFYFAGSLLSSQTIFGETALTASYALDRKTLYSCVGCQATVKIKTEDYGHNYAKDVVVSGKLFPYPASLVLWYPMQEGTGKIAAEALGTGLDLTLGSMDKPWTIGNKLYFYHVDDVAMTSKTLAANEEASSFSVEMKVTRQQRTGNIITWKGTNGWSIGINTNGRYYVSNGSTKIDFPVTSVLNAEAHLVWVFEDNTITMYKNGSRVTQKTMSPKITWKGAGKPQFGKDGITNAARVSLADVRIYDAALDADQVKSLYEDKLDINEGEIYVVRATDLTDREGLMKDQSCGVAGRSYLRQQDATSSDGVLKWNVDAATDNYQLFLLMRNYVSEESRVEVLVNGTSAGYARFKSTGLWESQLAENMTLTLSGGINEIALRPIGDLSIAAVALVSAQKELDAASINYGAEDWKNPDPRVAVEMRYGSGDNKIAYPNFRIRNLTGTTIEDIRLRYYYSGEGESVQAVSYHPYMPMSISPDAGSVYYAEMTLDQALSAYDYAYYGNGPQLGLSRVPNSLLWEIFDDPSYVAGAENGYVNGVGVALLDNNGDVLNEWACFDADGVADKPKKKVRALVSDEKFGSNNASTIKLVVENDGSAVVKGFEARYYFRDNTGNVEMGVYDHEGASVSMVAAGGDLYYVSVLYPTTILNPGESTSFRNGAKFELHYPNWAAGFDVSDDPSYYGIAGSEMVVADSVVVLNNNGNLLWGNAPKPNFTNEYDGDGEIKDVVHREGDNILVEIDVEGYYTLETVNAAGVPLLNLYSGTWTVGEHVISLAGKDVRPGSYAVLRLGSKIISWQLLK